MTKIPRSAINMHAKLIARNLVKAELKRQGIKVSWIEASELTRAANHLLECEPDIYELAERAVKAKMRKHSNLLRGHK